MGTNRPQRPITDRELKAWLASGAVDRGVGESLTFVARSAAAQAGKATWILRYRLNGRSKEKVLGRYPELTLEDARALARQDRVQIERGVDVAAAKQAEKALLRAVPTVQRLGEVWFAKDIQPRYKHPEVVARVLRKHIDPVLVSVAPPDVQPAHIDRVLSRIVAGGAPTVAKSTRLCPQGNRATACCTNASSGQASAKARIYFRLRGEKPFMSGKAARRSFARRSMTFVPQPCSA